MTIKKSQIIIGIFLLLIVGTFFLVEYSLKIKKDIIPTKGGIQIYNVAGGQFVESPLLIKGIVTGGRWSGFEGQVGRVELIESDGRILGSTPLIIKSDPMKFPTSFEANLIFDTPKEDEISIVFYNENPSGIPENSEVMSFIVKTSTEKSKIKLYFGKEGENSCTNLFPIEREIIKTEGIARATIEELLMGLTIEEEKEGYFTSINKGVKINSLNIVDGIAKIDFDESMERGIGGSCRVSAIRQQINQTLMQFSSIKKVIISVDGRTKDILQP